jgi:hypothetical protein
MENNFCFHYLWALEHWLTKWACWYTLEYHKLKTGNDFDLPSYIKQQMTLLLNKATRSSLET